MSPHLSHGGWPGAALRVDRLPLLEKGLSVVLAGGLSGGELEAGEGGEDLLVGVIRVLWGKGGGRRRKKRRGEEEEDEEEEGRRKGGHIVKLITA